MNITNRARQLTGVMTIALTALIFTMIGGTNQSQAGYFYSLPSCDAPRVHARIVSRFNRADATLWYKGIRMSSIGRAYEKNYNIYPSSQINRRYCRGKAAMANGRYRNVYFLIEEKMGLAGIGWEVEYCLRGSDYWHAYGGSCRVLRK